MELSAAVFQSLLYWIRPSDRLSDVRLVGGLEFQSLLYWIRPSDLKGRLDMWRESEVSILVVLD